jgi:hypothetical protein
MLRTLFEVAETQGGEQLATLATLAYAVGALLILWRALSPLLGGVLEAAAAQRGMHLGFSLACPACNGRTVVGSKCEHCGAPVILPVPVRTWAWLKAPGQLRRRPVAYGLAFLGSTAFVIVTVVGALSLGAFSPRGVLERLFFGIAAIAWAGAGFLLGRVVSLSRVGPLARARELVFGALALSLCFCAAVLAHLARPVEAKCVATLRAEGDAVVVGDQRLPAQNGEVNLEYQLVESPVLGTTFAVPLAFTAGQGSVRLHHEDLERWFLDATWQRAAVLEGRGFSVKRRSETFRIEPGARYEVRLGDREPQLKKL